MSRQHLNWLKIMGLSSTGLVSLLATQVQAQSDQAASLSSGSVAIQDQILVTANKREQSLASIDSSVQIVTAQELKAAGVTKIAELEKVFPGLLIRSRGNRAYPGISVRGMSSPNFYSPTVQLYLDGVPQDMAFITQQLVNVERVELLRGPQGTLYGGNAYAGVINVVTQQPEQSAKVRIQATLANQKRLADLSVASARTDSGLYADVNLRWEEQPGRIEDTSSGRDNIDDSKNKAAQIRLGYAPESSPLSVQFSLGRDELESHEEVYVRESLLDEREYDSSTQGPEGYLDRQVNSYALTASYDFDQATLTSISAWQEREMDRFLGGLNYPEQQESFSQELRLNFDTDSTENLIGLWLENQEFTRRDPGYPGYFGPSVNRVEKDNLALFGESRIQLSPQLDLTAGLRWEKSESSIDFQRSDTGAFSFSNDDGFTNVTPKLSLGWQHSAQHRFYISTSKGYKPGGFNHAVSNAGDEVSFDPEESINVELGWRANLLDNRLQLNSVVYWVDTQDKQLYVGPLGMQVLRNVGDANSYGLELDARWQASDALMVKTALMLGRAELKDAVDPVTGVSYDGKRLPYSPDTQLQLMADYRIDQNWLPGDLSLNAGARYFSEIFFEESNTLSQKAYTLVDASLQLALHNGLEVRLFGDNLTDEIWRSSSFMFGPGDVRSTLGEGRVLGVSAAVSF